MNEFNLREEKRIAALRDANILDTLPEQEFDDLTLLASQICETPIALISLTDTDRQWFKSRVGYSATEGPRDISFCNHAIAGEDLFIVSDARKDLRFADNPCVATDPGVVFYAGAPLITADGHALGALCVIDHKPHKLSANQKRSLAALARSTMSLIDARTAGFKRERAQLNAITASPGPAGLLFQNEERAERSATFDKITPYIIATGVVVLAALFKGVVIDRIIQIESPFLLFFIAVLLSAWRGGLGPGVYATGLAALLAAYFFLAPYGDLLGHTTAQYVRVFLFICEGALTAYLCASRLRSERQAQNATGELEQNVRRRTAELARANVDLKEEIKERTVLQRELREARDAAIESAKLKSEFLANMSHEIRTPMNGVIGMTGLLLDTPLDTEQRRFAEIIRNCGDSLMTIINDILDFSKIEAGKLDLETLDFNLRDLVEGTVEIFSDRARDNENELATLVYADVPLGLRGDPNRIRQVLTNFIGNAVKFTKKGDVIVRVKKQSGPRGEVVLRFSVSDTGIGIGGEIREKLFQPFTQSDASTTREFGGTGLGLSISKRLVDLMGGTIGVESAPGKGSTFWFTLKLEQQDHAASAVSSRSDGVEIQLGGKRILIVDDNKVNREIMAYQARSWAMDVYEADGPKDCLDRLRSMADQNAPAELIIMDLQMPGINGLETIRMLREMPAGQQTNDSVPPIIMISSSAKTISTEELGELGIESFLTKPYRQAELLAAVRRSFGLFTEPVFDALPKTNISREIPAFVDIADDAGRILLVEDNPVNQMVAQTQLRKGGYYVEVAANGAEAIETLEKRRFDLILMDCQMPVMDGYEATRQIRLRDWTAAATPIIAMTAHAIDGEREKCLRAGMNDYLSKPVEKEELRRVVRRWMAMGIEGDPEISYAPNRFEDRPEPATLSGSANGSECAIDVSVLDDITGNDLELRTEVVEMYLLQTPEQLDDIERAIATGDDELLYQAAHKNLGGSTMCGMTAVIAPMRMLEQMGQNRRSKEAAPFLQQAKEAFDRIRIECELLLGEKVS